MSAHDPVTGALDREVLDLKGSASNWRSYLAKKDYDSHPLAYLCGIYLISGPLGCGKSTLVASLLEEAVKLIKPSKLGRVVYYSGSGSDALLETYNEDEVELFDKRSKESFLTVLKEIQSTAQTTPHEEKKMNILVVDDACNDADIMPSSVKSQTELSHLMMQARHIPVMIMLTSQKMSSLPTFARANASHTFVFRTRCPSELKTVVNEANFTKKEVEAALSSLTENTQFVWLQNLHRRLVKGFSEPVVY